MAELPDGNLVVSFRNISTVAIIDRRTGAIAWKLDAPALAQQHDPRPLADGNLLIFDNGPHRRDHPAPSSRVFEVGPALAVASVPLRLDVEVPPEHDGPSTMETRDIERRVHAAVGKALGRFAMLRPGDRVVVGVSGGKDSLTLLSALVAHRRHAPFTYEVIAVTIEQGKFKRAIESLRPIIRNLGVEWVLRDDPRTLKLVRDGVAHGCDVCSRHRRHSLYRLAGELSATVLALGHTADDCAESLLRNVLFNGRIASLPPVAESRRGGLRVIRPLVFVSEALTEAYARAAGLLPVGCVCGDRDSVRREIRSFLASLDERHAGVRDSIAAALGNVNPYLLFGASGPSQRHSMTQSTDSTSTR